MEHYGHLELSVDTFFRDRALAGINDRDGDLGLIAVTGLGILDHANNLHAIAEDLAEDDVAAVKPTVRKRILATFPGCS